VAVPTPHGRVKRSTGTNHKPTAKAMERMLVALGPKGQRAWDLLDRVANGTLILATLYDAYANNDLDGLRKRIKDANLADHVDAWQSWLVDRVSVDTCAHYLAQLRTLVAEGKPYPRSQFTAPEVARWLATRTGLAQKRKRAGKGSRRAEDKLGRPISGATKRKYLAAAQSFATYLVEVGVLASNPIRDVQAPPPGKPRVVEIPLPTSFASSRTRQLPTPLYSHCCMALASRFRPRSPAWSRMWTSSGARYGLGERRPTRATGSSAWQSGPGPSSRNTTRP